MSRYLSPEDDAYDIAMDNHLEGHDAPDLTCVLCRLDAAKRKMRKEKEEQEKPPCQSALGTT